MAWRSVPSYFMPAFSSARQPPILPSISCVWMRLRFSSIPFPLDAAVADNHIKFSGLVDIIDIFQAHQPYQAVIAFEGDTEDDVLAILVELFQALFAACIAGGINGEILPD